MRLIIKIFNRLLPLKRTYYEILEVSRLATSQELKTSFHRLSKALHPDTSLLPSDQAAQQFLELYEAYECLSDPFKRHEYDEEIKNSSKLSEWSDASKFNSYEFVYESENRRPFSGGELFSLFLLAVVFAISLLLGVGLGIFNGRPLQVAPSWLSTLQSLVNLIEF